MQITLRRLFNFSRGGNLYTWGRISSGAGIDQFTQPDQLVPRRVQDFKGDVAKFASGLDFSAVVTTSGQLYTFGLNNHGQLGLGHRDNTQQPALVETFQEHGLKVVDVALGSTHGVALTHDGSVWSWGWSGRSRIPGWNNFFPPASGVGVTAYQDLLVPTLVDTVKAKGQAVQAGVNFTLLLDANNRLWGWGKGEDGQLGNSISQDLSYPEANPVWDQKLKKEKSQVKKVKTAGKGTIALLENGKLIGWGHSNVGSLGLRQQEFIRDDIVFQPSDVNTQYLRKGEKVVDFDLSYDGLIFYTDHNNVYFSGAGIYYIPNLAYKGKDLPRVVKVAASGNSFAFVTENGDLYTSANFIEPYHNISEHHLFTKIEKQERFDGGDVLDIGGSYNVRYAIVQN